MCLSVFTAHAQKIIEKTDSIKNPALQGVALQLDVASVLTSSISNGELSSYEAGVQFNFKHKYYPIVEAGYASANKTTDDKINFTTQAPFVRFGIDINMLKNNNSKFLNNLFLAGLRLGMSNFNYTISNITINNDYWGGNPQIINYSDLPASTKLWWEIVVGVRVEVTRNFYMGWMVRSKSLLSKDSLGEAAPWYIPGFGINATSNWGINYNIGYQF